MLLFPHYNKLDIYFADHKVGIALGVFFTILVVLTATAIVAFWYLR